VNSLKGVSSRVLHKEFPDHIGRYLYRGHLWSPSYSCDPLSPLGQELQDPSYRSAGHYMLTA